MQNKERAHLQTLLRLETLAEKKTKIYARLLIETSIAEEMQRLSSRHAERKEQVGALLSGNLKNENETGMYAINVTEDEK